MAKVLKRLMPDNPKYGCHSQPHRQSFMARRFMVLQQHDKNKAVLLVGCLISLRHRRLQQRANPAIGLVEASQGCIGNDPYKVQMLTSRDRTTRNALMQK